MSKYKLTREAERRLHEELKFLREVRRPETIQAVAEARRKGDLSENAEYDAAREEQHRLEHRIHQVETMIRNVEILDNQLIADDRVYIGAKVGLLDLKSETEITYMLVDEYEADFAQKKISTVSPIGQGLLGKAVGEEVEITVPRGTLRYRVLSISRS